MRYYKQKKRKEIKEIPNENQHTRIANELFRTLCVLNWVEDLEYKTPTSVVGVSLLIVMAGAASR